MILVKQLGLCLLMSKYIDSNIHNIDSNIHNIDPNIHNIRKIVYKIQTPKTCIKMGFFL